MAKGQGNGKTLTTFDMLTEFYQGMIKPQFDKLIKKIEKGFSEAKSEREEIKTELRFIKDDIKGVKADLSGTVTKKEFNQLKNEVETLHA